MHLKHAFPIVLLTAAAGADDRTQLGDANGDGRVSFADSYLFAQGSTPAPGSDDFATAFPCTFSAYPAERLWESISPLIYLEALRRSAPEPLPHFFERWPSPAIDGNPPPQADPRVILEVISSSHTDGQTETQLLVRISTTVRLDALNIVLRGEGIELHPPAPQKSEDADLITSTEYAIITGGLLAYRSHFDRRLGFESEDGFSLRTEIPRGTPPGVYRIEIVEGTEAVSDAGEVIRPETIPGELEVTAEIDSEGALPFPRIPFIDLEERKIGGEVEFRINGGEAFPGGEVTATIQVRFGRPVNKLPIRLLFDAGSFRVLRVDPLYADPRDGLVHHEDYRTIFYHKKHIREGCVEFEYNPNIYVPYVTSGPNGAWQPPLSYFAPLDEWLDLARIHFNVLIRTRGLGELPLRLDRNVLGDPIYLAYPDLLFWAVGCPGTAALWSYEPWLGQPGSITVLGEFPPPIDPPPPLEPERAAINFLLGGSEGRAGDIVGVPVEMITGVDVYEIRLVFSYDIDRLQPVGVRVPYIDPDGVAREDILTFDDFLFGHSQIFCENHWPDPSICRYGHPYMGKLRGSPAGDSIPEGTVIFDLKKLYDGFSDKDTLSPEVEWWEAGPLHPIATVLFRIIDGAPLGEAAIAGASADWLPAELAVSIYSECSANPVEAVYEEWRRDVPASMVRTGTITVIGNPSFIRGDFDGSGKLDISDPIGLLMSLFSGGAPPSCPDAGDANDDGVLDISDAIYNLTFQFLGGPAPLEPYPGPGTDPTPDGLECR